MFVERFSQLHQALQECRYSSFETPISASEALHHFHISLQKSAFQGGIVYVIGNGGSAGIASHFSNDLMKALKIASQTLFDSNLMTCLSNDIGYENVFSYPLERLGKAHDLLVAISSSGQSKNILNAVEICRARSIPVITLSGFLQDNPLRRMGFLNFWIDRADYGLVETAHFALLHAVIDLYPKPNSSDYANLLKGMHAR